MTRQNGAAYTRLTIVYLDPQRISNKTNSNWKNSVKEQDLKLTKISFHKAGIPYFASLYRVSQITAFFTNWRFVAILHQTSLYVSFFQIAFAYFVSLYHILVIFTKLEMEFEDVTELLQSHDKNFMTLKEFQRKWFLEIDFIPGKNAVKIIEMTTNNLEYYINLVIKAEAGLKGLNPILKEVLLWVKCCHTALHATEKSFMKVLGEPLKSPTLARQDTSHLHELYYSRRFW